MSVLFNHAIRYEWLEQESIQSHLIHDTKTSSTTINAQRASQSECPTTSNSRSLVVSADRRGREAIIQCCAFLALFLGARENGVGLAHKCELW